MHAEREPSQEKKEPGVLKKTALGLGAAAVIGGGAYGVSEAIEHDVMLPIAAGVATTVAVEGAIILTSDRSLVPRYAATAITDIYSIGALALDAPAPAAAMGTAIAVGMTGVRAAEVFSLRKATKEIRSKETPPNRHHLKLILGEEPIDVPVQREGSA